ncbi:MAG: hypothetical protein HY288_17050 [Planctomycetia bacterium]|nr:hypothetical protein [Planctomycetia bacterium]
MKPRIVLFALTLGLMALAAPRLAFAQAISTFPQGHSDNPNGPTVSPYLNLLQSNNQLNSVPNYQSLVKPLIDQRNAIQRQGNSLQHLQQQVASGAGGGVGGRGTGHTTHFMNYSHYYPRLAR